MTKTIPFKVSYVDNLGQGVSKMADKITLLNKTLPGDEGECIVIHETTKIYFAEVSHFSHRSSDHIEAICPHYTSCQGCHYLHTTYKREVQLKKESYTKLFYSFTQDLNTNFVHASLRHGYRNRIQLHYDKKKQLLGFKNRKGITPINNCLMASVKIQEKLADLIAKDLWKLLKQEKNNGHIELYEKDHNVEVSINKGYASGGFSQVNHEMNQKLIKYLKEQSKDLAPHDRVIDLFGGSGNLSAHLASPTLVVDQFEENKLANSHQKFLSLNIYSKNAVNILKKNIQDKKVKWLIMDPPRSGLKNITEFTESLKPERITYISCNPQTQKRDLNSLLEHYNLLSITFFDLFPSTFHLESVAQLVRKNILP